MTRRGYEPRRCKHCMRVAAEQLTRANSDSRGGMRHHRSPQIRNAHRMSHTNHADGTTHLLQTEVGNEGTQKDATADELGAVPQCPSASTGTERKALSSGTFCPPPVRAPRFPPAGSTDGGFRIRTTPNDRRMTEVGGKIVCRSPSPTMPAVVVPLIDDFTVVRGGGVSSLTTMIANTTLLPRPPPTTHQRAAPLASPTPYLAAGRRDYYIEPPTCLTNEEEEESQ